MSEISSIASLEQGDWIQFGKYGSKDGSEALLWRVLESSADSVSIMTHYIITKKAFDVDPKITGGFNRWQDSTLRHWLNSGNSAGKVDFGPHPKPSKKYTDYPYDNEQGFLKYLDDHEMDQLIKSNIKTPVPKPMGKGNDKTEDFVTLITYKDYKKLPEELQKGIPSPLYMKDYDVDVSEQNQYWSRTPNYDYNGVYLLNHWSKSPQAMNSGAYCAWGIRPCITLAGESFTGKGSKEYPYVPCAE